MKQMTFNALKPASIGGYMIVVLFLLISPGCQKLNDVFHRFKDSKNKPEPTLPGNYNQVNLVANNDGYGAAHIDSFLVNGWGIAFSATGTPWLGSQGRGVSTVYNSEGVIAGISPVRIPSPSPLAQGNPTGVVFNASNTDFLLSNGQAGRFLFVGLDGILSGWNGAAGGTALLIKNNVATSTYTGLAIASDGADRFLYAANFRGRKIEVFDRLFNQVTTKPFNDPYLPAGYSPFNIQAVGDWLYVMYAKVGPDGRDEAGVGNGYVNIFGTNGKLLKRFASNKLLNSPWGVAQAPDGFFADENANTKNAILIGNFGDGKINAYKPDGTFLGQIRINDKPVEIEGLWAITFPPVTSTIDQHRLYFAAGPDEEKDGLFGYLIKK